MPTRPEINQVYKVLIRFTVSDVFLGETHFSWRIPSFTFDDENCTDLVEAIGGALVSSNVNDAQHTSVEAPEWIVQNYDDPTIADISIPSAYVGGEAGQMLPTQTALLVSQRTARRGRSYRGRQYWPGYTEASSNENAVAAATVEAMGVGQAEVLEQVSSAFPGAVAVVISETLAIATPIVSLLVEDTWATIRRRNERLR
jgi:hypothetical protein